MWSETLSHISNWSGPANGRTPKSERTGNCSYCGHDGDITRNCFPHHWPYLCGIHHVTSLCWYWRILDPSQMVLPQPLRPIVVLPVAFAVGHAAPTARNCPVPFQIARFMRPTWGPPGADRTQMGPMLAPWTLLSGFPPVWSSSAIITLIIISVVVVVVKFTLSSSSSSSSWSSQSLVGTVEYVTSMG